MFKTRRDPTSDLWRETLSRIPSVFGRLVYLAATRSSTSDAYEHDVLTLLHGEGPSHRALRRSHAQTFSEWLCLNLREQKADLDLYLSGWSDRSHSAILDWVRLETHLSLLPSSATKAERELYLSDFHLLLKVLAKEYGVAA